MYIYMYTYIYIYIYNIHIKLCVHACLFVRPSTYDGICGDVRFCLGKHTNHTQTQTQTYTHTHKHIQI